MTPTFRELRYVRRTVAELEPACQFANDVFGLMPEDRTDAEAFFRSDYRFYSLCLTTELPPAIGFSVGKEGDLEEFATGFEANGFKTTTLEGADAERRLIKKGISVTAPNGVDLEIVWRHMESGWPYHGSRDTGLNGFSAVQLTSTDIAADAKFWQRGAGLEVSDYIGDAHFFTIGIGHHQIALYPSEKNRLLGACWQVEKLDHVMRHWHYLLNRQVPIAHGPGRQPTSGSAFVTARTDDDFLMSYATAMDQPPELGARNFKDDAASHCSWGSPSDLPEFGGEAK